MLDCFQTADTANEAKVVVDQLFSYLTDTSLSAWDVVTLEGSFIYEDRRLDFRFFRAHWFLMIPLGISIPQLQNQAPFNESGFWWFADQDVTPLNNAFSVLSHIAMMLIDGNLRLPGHLPLTEPKKFELELLPPEELDAFRRKHKMNITRSMKVDVDELQAFPFPQVAIEKVSYKVRAHCKIRGIYKEYPLNILFDREDPLSILVFIHDKARMTISPKLVNATSILRKMDDRLNKKQGEIDELEQAWQKKLNK